MPELQPYRRILALIAFDASDAAIAHKALLLARLNRAALDFVHVIAPDASLDGGYPAGSAAATAAALEAAARRRLEFLAARTGAGEASCHAYYGAQRPSLLRHVAAAPPDLVVTGAAGADLPGRHDRLILASPVTTRGGRWLVNLMGTMGARLRMLRA